MLNSSTSNIKEFHFGAAILIQFLYIFRKNSIVLVNSFSIFLISIMGICKSVLLFFNFVINIEILIQYAVQMSSISPRIINKLFVFISLLIKNNLSFTSNKLFIVC